MLSCTHSQRAMQGCADMTRFEEWTPEGVIPAVLRPRRLTAG